MTREDYEYLKILRESEYGDEINYIARDDDGTLWGFIQKPVKSYTFYPYNEGQWLNVNGSGFQEIDNGRLGSIPCNDDAVEVEAAISAYEREQKDDVECWPDWKKRAALCNYEFGKEDA